MALAKVDSKPPVQNKYYNEDLTYDLEFHRVILSIMGVNLSISLASTERKQLTYLDRLVALLARTFISGMLMFFVVPCGCHIFLIETDLHQKLRLLGPYMFTCMSFVKYVIVLARFESIRTCIDFVIADWRDVDSIVGRSIMLRSARSCRNFAKFCIGMALGSAISYSWIFPFINDDVDSSMFPLNETRQRPTVYPSEFYIFDNQLSPMYEITFFGHGLSVTIAATVHCGICILAVKLVVHACNRYEIVAAFIQAIDDEPGRNDVDGIKHRGGRRRIFVDIIKRHMYAIEFVPLIESLFNEIYLIDLIATTVSICLLGYYLIAGWENGEIIGIVSYVIATIVELSNVFILCYIGELLTEQCRQVAMACYMTNWWRLGVIEARALILIIAASNIPVHITAGKMLNLSMETFGAVLKAAMAYLNVLRKVTQEK